GSDGCWAYQEGSLIEDAFVATCGAVTFEIKAAVSTKVEAAEAWFTALWKDGSTYYDAIAQIAPAKFEGSKATALMDGYIYTLDSKVVTSYLLGDSGHSLDVTYFLTEPTVTSSTISSGGYQGVLSFSAGAGNITSALSLAVDFGGQMVSVQSSSGGYIVPSVLLQDATVRYLGKYPWGPGRTWSVQGLSISDASNFLYSSSSQAPASLVFLADSEKSLNTSCYGEHLTVSLTSDPCTTTTTIVDGSALMSAATYIRGTAPAVLAAIVAFVA
ncbi:unnamed protein product, partial [Effrenium voratum]